MGVVNGIYIYDQSSNEHFADRIFILRLMDLNLK